MTNSYLCVDCDQNSTHFFFKIGIFFLPVRQILATPTPRTLHYEGRVVQTLGVLCLIALPFSFLNYGTSQNYSLNLEVTKRRPKRSARSLLVVL